MKKVLSLLAIIIWGFISFESFAQNYSQEEIDQIFKTKYDYSSLDYELDFSENSDFTQAVMDNSFLREHVDPSELNFSSITKISWSDGIAVILIKNRNDASQSVAIAVDLARGYSNIERALVANNNVNNEGTGTIEFYTQSGSYSYEFNNGANATIMKKSCFRECFDQAFDDICDGFIGCLAWYTNPGVPIATAAYCEIKC